MVSGTVYILLIIETVHSLMMIDIWLRWLWLELVIIEIGFIVRVCTVTFLGIGVYI